VLTRAAVRMPGHVRSLTLIEPSLFYLLASAERVSEYAEIRAVADRVIRYVNENDTTEAARGFIDYWVGPEPQRSSAKPSRTNSSASHCG
jgi:hypothetical protein